MATIVYLDVEDEITSAATRIRRAEDPRVALVLPYGSRVATSRINFRLLAREATLAGRRLDIIAGDASARALAASAGLPVFGSVREFEDALEGPDEDGSEGTSGPGDAPDGGAPDGGAQGGGSGSDGGGGGSARPATGSRVGAAAVATRASSRATDAADDDVPSTSRRTRGRGADGGDRAPAAVPAVTRTRDEPRVVHASRRWRPGTGSLVGVGLLVLALVVAGVAGYLLLPSATITVVPRVGTIGPITLDVRADPAVGRRSTRRTR